LEYIWANLKLFGYLVLIFVNLGRSYWWRPFFRDIYLSCSGTDSL